MAGKLGTVLKETGWYLSKVLKALRFWRRAPPLTTFAQLVEHVESRSKYVGQTTLFGYVKTRAGTRYVSLFEDEKFAHSLNIAKWEIFLAGLCDLAAYAAAGIGRRASASADETTALAIHIVESALAKEEIPAERPQGFDDVRSAFRTRARTTCWSELPAGNGLFQNSISALVHWAPIADELKVLDAEIVKNSMRFKWKSVRDQFNEVLDAEAVLADWRSVRTRETAPPAG